MKIGIGMILIIIGIICIFKIKKMHYESIKKFPHTQEGYYKYQTIFFNFYAVYMSISFLIFPGISLSLDYISGISIYNIVIYNVVACLLIGQITFLL